MATSKIEESSSSCSSRFIWKIENFSRLNSDVGGVSDVFSVGNYKWKAIIYPKGEGLVYDYLSLYFRPVDLEEPVNIQLKIAVTSQTDCSNAAKERIGKFWFPGNHEDDRRGWEEFMRLSELHNPAERYIVKDTCVIKVEVTCMLNGGFHDDDSEEDDEDNLDEDGDDNVRDVKRCKLRDFDYKWKIENFSDINPNDGLLSSVFTAGRYKWKAQIYPKGEGEVYDHLSLFLIPVDFTSEPVYTNVRVIIFSQTDCKNTKEEEEDMCMKDGRRLSLWRLIQLSDFHNPAKGYLANDTCTLGFEVSCGGTLKEMRDQKMGPCKRCIFEAEISEDGANTM